MRLTLDYILSLPKIGSGNFRDAYRDGPFVYKVEYGEGIDLECNMAEWNNVKRLRGSVLPDNVAIPATTLLYVDGLPVIVMDYVEGTLTGDCYDTDDEVCDGSCLPPKLADALLDAGIDTAYGNVVLSDDTYYLIDLDADLRS